MALSPEEIRIECLKAAVGPTGSIQDTIRLAAVFEAWVLGGDKAAINAALDAWSSTEAKGPASDAN